MKWNEVTRPFVPNCNKMFRRFAGKHCFTYHQNCDKNPNFHRNCENNWESRNTDVAFPMKIGIFIAIPMVCEIMKFNKTLKLSLKFGLNGIVSSKIQGNQYMCANVQC